MDLAEYLKHGIKGIHKCPVVKRSEVSRKTRQLNRTNLLLGKRNIKNISLSENTPIKMEPRKERVSRAEQLKKWKQERDKKLAEKRAKAKPIFKVSSCVSHIGFEEAYGTIKGKPIKKNSSNMSSTYKLAESTHKFKAPSNIKPIQFGRNKPATSTPAPKSRKQIKFDNEEAPMKIPTKGESAVAGKAKDSKPKITTIKQTDLPSTTIRQLRSRTVTQGGTMKANKISPKKAKQVRKNIVKERVNTINNNQFNQKKKITASKRNAEEAGINIETDHATPSRSGNASFETLSNLNQKSVVDDTDPKVSTAKNKINKKAKATKKAVKETKTNEIKSVNKLFSVKESLMSPAYPIENVIDSQLNLTNQADINVETTPNTKQQNVTVYVSPFVTMSRGKNSARKEFKSRHSKGGLDLNSSETTGTKAAAIYFYEILDNEIERIEKLCDDWNKYKDEMAPPEEACDMINTATGQSQLLINKRMKQFRGLIASCEAQETNPLITSQDLHGYWDLILIQAQNVNNRFDNLIKLRENNWEEIIPQKKNVIAPKVKKPAPKKATQSTSTIRNAIRAAKLKAKNPNNLGVHEDVKVFEAGFFSITSPNKSLLLRKTPSKTRKSLLQSVLSSETKRISTTPGLTMVKVSQVARGVDNVDQIEQTPGKSILKQENVKSARKSKVVLFNDDIIKSKIIEPNFDEENDINVSNTDSVQNDSLRKSRRSRRLSSKSKLFE